MFQETTEHCCQLEEIGGFDSLEEVARVIAEDDWLDKHEGRGAEDRPFQPPDYLPVTIKHMARAIENEMSLKFSHFATTAGYQTLAEKALRALKFKKVATFPGVKNRPLTLWFRARETNAKGKGGTHARRLRARPKCKTARARA